MKKYIDFVLEENMFYTKIFRFYPRKSSCHSFNENSPKTWQEVYKVYCHYSIFKRWKNDNSIEWLFRSECDEGSMILEVATRIEYISLGKKEVVIKDKFGKNHTIKLLENEIHSFGDGVSWTINEYSSWFNPQSLIYEIVLWNSNKIGFKFSITQDRLKEFGKYLNDCCEYMLKHGVPI